jgi:hypothetical protein
MAPKITWPDGKKFAFTVFDDPDHQTLAQGKMVYSFLADLGFRTTKAVWPLSPLRETNSQGETCANREYLADAIALQKLGFEIGYHNATPHSVTRSETIQALDLFKTYFGHYPSAMANHYNEEAIYWGPARLSGICRRIYSLVTLGQTENRHFGHVEKHPSFWGDICRERIRYCRNFVYAEINTLAACPWMPYHDPARPYVNAWFSSSEGANCPSFLKTVSEANQDSLEEEGGACIMYAHFGHGFVDAGALDARFRNLMTRMSRKRGWFVPVSVLLDYLVERNGEILIADGQRRNLETKWLRDKMLRGTS